MCGVFFFGGGGAEGAQVPRRFVETDFCSSVFGPTEVKKKSSPLWRGVNGCLVGDSYDELVCLRWMRSRRVFFLIFGSALPW